MLLDINKGKMYVHTEINSLHIIDLKNFKEVLRKDKFGMYFGIYKDKIVAWNTSFDTSINFYKLSKDKIINQRSMKLHLPVPRLFRIINLVYVGMTTSFSIDEKRELLFFPSFSTGFLYVIDLKSDKLVKKIFLEKGIRYSNYNKNKDLIFVSGYVNGGLYIIHPKKGIIKKLYVGPRARNISFSCDGTKAFVASSVGAFEINLAKLKAIRGNYYGLKN